MFLLSLTLSMFIILKFSLIQVSLTSFYQVYIDSISKLYERELQEFFEKARQALQFKPKSTDGKRHGLGKEGKGSAGDLSKLGTRSGKLSSLQDTRGSDQDLTGRQKFDVASIFN